MGLIVVSPLARIAEMAVRHRCGGMLSLMGVQQHFHRPACIPRERHLLLALNDIVKPTGPLIAPEAHHVAAILDFARGWDRSAPLLVHCWMGVSRSPAAALLIALALAPDQDEVALAQRLRAASRFATPNARLIELGDAALGREGRLVAAVEALGRGAEADGNAPFLLPVTAEDAARPVPA
ncbi:protein tyrosine phosphatase [Rhizobium rhizosphaerae]|uniref:Protein tyrosine phosphatase n=1 Tax=Xaviernesmea rhizosphaerae TaxID=1672749 RepID=A0ABX3PCA2_9HYPH|nr:tyrosine phosphatase family protein [Xaviernesmea rhizosphaerae]OQP85656.1 protein tyrosine phosphatase [Xaviernesmea rhizosphaerae]